MIKRQRYSKAEFWREFKKAYRNSSLNTAEYRESEWIKYRKNGGHKYTDLIYKRVRERELKKRGLTENKYGILLSLQNGCCAICKQPPTKRKLAVDHCHKTGRRRGLLCHRCNVGLGFFKESLENLTEAIKYLEKHIIATV